MHTPSLDMISTLISFNTVSNQSNLSLITFIDKYLNEFNIASKIIYNEDKTKANLLATIGPNIDGGVVLSGHTDVVPVEGQNWTYCPFKPKVDNGRLYGRGSCDMKGFVGVVLAMVPQMINANLTKPIHIALSYDEEVGCIGVRSMIDDMVKTLPQISAVIVGEPTNMEVVHTHKGITCIETTVKGNAAHSSQIDKAVSAVMTSANLIDYISQILEKNQLNHKNHDDLVEPPFSTLHVGQVSGGHAVNVVASECKFLWDIRNIANDAPDTFIDDFKQHCQSVLENKMLPISEKSAISHDILTQSPGLKYDKDNQAAQLCDEILNRKSDPKGVSFATEAGLFQNAGYDCVVCGPGSIDQAHKPDEYIELSQIDECVDFISKLIKTLETNA